MSSINSQNMLELERSEGKKKKKRERERERKKKIVSLNLIDRLNS